MNTKGVCVDSKTPTLPKEVWVVFGENDGKPIADYVAEYRYAAMEHAGEASASESGKMFSPWRVSRYVVETELAAANERLKQAEGERDIMVAHFDAVDVEIDELEGKSVEIIRDLQAKLSAAESKLEAARAEQIEREKNFEELEAMIYGTDIGSGEDFLLRDLAVRDLIDEVKAMRSGIGFTHIGPDPIIRLEDKWTGVSTRDFIVRTLAHIEIAKRRV